MPDLNDICHAQPGDGSLTPGSGRSVAWDVILYGINGDQLTLTRGLSRIDAEALARRVGLLVLTWANDPAGV